MNDIQHKISAILGSPQLSKAEKIAHLRQIYLDACALQRAANEGGMVIGTPESESGDDVRQAELALRELGIDPGEIENENAATL